MQANGSQLAKRVPSQSKSLESSQMNATHVQEDGRLDAEEEQGRTPNREIKAIPGALS